MTGLTRPSMESGIKYFGTRAQMSAVMNIPYSTSYRILRLHWLRADSLTEVTQY
jgi:hypothetical protein